MSAVHFLKMQGCGNDFLILDCIGKEPLPLETNQISAICDRHFGIGADGVIVLRDSQLGDVGWNFYNADGSTAEMCGNGARCAFRYLFDRVFPSVDTLTLETLSGNVSGRRAADGKIEIQFLSKPAEGFSYTEKALLIDGHTLVVYCIRTGPPHAVVEVSDLASYPVHRIGSAIQKHAAFSGEGTNVTFFQKVVGNQILSTTYERGMARETLACGTGAVASAIVFAELYPQKFPIEVRVPGGDLTVDITPSTQRVCLIGPAAYVAAFDVEALPTAAAAKTFRRPDHAI